jgi:hypothetical protein
VLDYSAEEIISSIKIAVEEVDSNEALGIETGELRGEEYAGGEHLRGEDPWLGTSIQDVSDGVKAIVFPSVDGREQPFLLSIGQKYTVLTSGNFEIVNLFH